MAAVKRNGRALAIVFGIADIATAILVYIGVFEGLPARDGLVDSAAALVVLLFAAAGVGLLAETRWAHRAALAASIVALVLGLALVATLSLTASYLSGVYGPVGRGGALILGLVAAMALPYLVVLPFVEIVWLARQRSARPAAAASAVEPSAASPATSES
jgi:hypothetical protein